MSIQLPETPPSQLSFSVPAKAVQPGGPTPIIQEGMDLLKSLEPQSALTTGFGCLVVDNCINVLRRLPESSLDLVITSPPNDGQPKYGNGERYGRDWYEDFFLKVTAEIHRTLKPHGSFVPNYRSKR